MYKYKSPATFLSFIHQIFLYTVTYYTPAVPVCHALPVNSLHSNPCQGTKSFESITTAVQASGAQASTINPSCIPHNPPKENDLNSSVLLEKGAAEVIAQGRRNGWIKTFQCG